MQDIIGFQIDFEVDSGKSYVILTGNGLGRHEVIGFQVEMIAKNKIPGVADLNLRERDLEIRFYYDVSGLISLSNYFKRQKVTKADFIRILRNITHALIGCKNYLLNDKNFIVNEKMIYLRPETLEVFLIYIPSNRSADVVESFRSFIINLVVNTANIETDDNFVQQILNLIKEETLCISEFDNALKKVAVDSTPNVNNRQDSIGVVNNDTPLGEKSSSESIKRSGNLVPVMLILLVILAVPAVKFSDAFAAVKVLPNPSGPLWGLGAAITVFVIVSGTLFYMRLRKKSSQIHESENPKTNKIPGSLQCRGLNGPEAQREISEISLPNLDETVILSSQHQPILVGANGEDDILISKPEFTLGRNNDTCDYVIRNKSIGRAHARIQSNNGTFFIADLDSKNGTFLNGDRLISNKQYELKPNDRVSFADLQFCFKV